MNYLVVNLYRFQTNQITKPMKIFPCNKALKPYVS